MAAKLPENAARTCKKLPRSGKNCCGSNKDSAAKGGEKHAERALRRPRRHYSRRQAAFETFPKSERFKAHIPPDRIPDSDIIHAPALCLRQANDREAIKSAQARLLSAFRPPQAHMSQP